MPIDILVYEIDQDEWSKAKDLQVTENEKPPHEIEEAVNSLSLRCLDDFDFVFEWSQVLQQPVQRIEHDFVPLFLWLLIEFETILRGILDTLHEFFLLSLVSELLIGFSFLS